MIFGAVTDCVKKGETKHHESDAIHDTYITYVMYGVYVSALVFAGKFEVGQLGHTIITICLETFSFIRCLCIQRYDMSWQGPTMTVSLVVHVKGSRVRITPE